MEPRALNQAAEARSPAVAGGDFGFVLLRGTGKTVTEGGPSGRAATMQVGRPVDFLRPTTASVVDDDGVTLEYELVGKGENGFAGSLRVMACRAATVASIAAIAFVAVSAGSIVGVLSGSYDGVPRMSVVRYEQLVKEEVDKGSPGFAASAGKEMTPEVERAAKAFMAAVKGEWQ